MCFKLKILFFMKVGKFLINTQTNKTTNCIRKTHLLLKYQTASNYLTMIRSTILKHAQTQHGNESCDLENILLCQPNLYQFSEVKTDTKHHNETETSKANEPDTTETGTLNSSVTQNSGLSKVEDGSATEIHLLTSDEKEERKLQAAEKRKADNLEQQPRVLKKAKLDTKNTELKRPGFSEERYSETSYYFENELRKVYPYYFTFTTFTKGRWVGETILDVFSREFRAHPVEEYKRNIENGSLTVNYEKVPVDYRLKHNDLLANTVHRHEVPVTSQTIKIVHLDDDIVVVDKPASIPVHPCGRYRHNTVVFILAKEYNLKNLRTIHRLDRLTSGLLLFGRSPTKARQLEHQIRNREVQKEYICRVEGEFPDEVVECNEPIKVVSFKIGVCKVSDKGKDCKTTFQKISYNGTTSVVLCKPLTGRMHQIRVHLQYLGFPVVNDPLYNHLVFGPLKGRGGDIGGRTEEELVRDLINIHNAENWLGIEGDVGMSMLGTARDAAECEGEPIIFRNEDKEMVEITRDNLSKTPSNIHVDDADATASNQDQNTSALDSNCPASAEIDNCAHKNNSTSHSKATVATQTGHESPDKAFNAAKTTFDKYCYDCKVRYRDPKPKDLVMYLHAWKYKGIGWEYETPLPSWGSADWIETP